ncbi:MAG TPA: flippase [Melioribacteraceae bacterium]|nr:flippase [Melioribacteraceae bacterium]
MLSKLKNISILSFGEFVSRILNFLSFAYLARVINLSDFGTIGFGTALINFLLNIVSFGLDRICLKEVTQINQLASNYLINISIIRIVLSSISFLIYLLILFFNSNFNLPLVLLGLTIFSTGLSFNYFAKAIEYFKVITTNQIVISILTIILYFIFVRNKNDFIIAVSILVSVSFISNFLFLHNLKEYIVNIKNKFSLHLIKQLLLASYPIFISSIMIAIYYFADTIMIGIIKKEYDVGIYSAANKVFLILTIPFSIIVSVFLPSIAKYYRKVNNSFVIYFCLISLTGVLLGFTTYLFAKNIIFLIYGETFLSSIIPLKILAINVILVGVNMSFGEPLTVWGKQKQYLIAVSIGAITNIILNLIFIPKYSYYGAAFTTLLSEFSVFVVLSYLFCRVREKNE